MGIRRVGPVKGPSGFSMAELLIVLSVLGILSAVSLPVFLEQKDKVIVEVTRANLDVIRACLGQYAARNPSNVFPRGDLNYFDLKRTLPEAQLPSIETEARFVSGTFSYFSDGTTYTLRTASTNRTARQFVATPTGVTSR